MKFLLTIFDLNYTFRGAVKSLKHAITQISNSVFTGGGVKTSPQNKRKKFLNDK